MTASPQFGEFELDRSGFWLRHKGTNSRLARNAETEPSRAT